MIQSKTRKGWLNPKRNLPDLIKKNEIFKSKSDLDALVKKFTAPRSELEKEVRLEEITPRDKVKKDSVDRYINTKIRQILDEIKSGRVDVSRKTQLEAQLAAYERLRIEDSLGSHSDGVDSNFKLKFYKWLQGQGEPEDIIRTPWGNQKIPDEEVEAYLLSFLTAKLDFTFLLQDLVIKAYYGGGLQGIKEHYLFYKYIVTGGWEMGNLNDFMDDYADYFTGTEISRFLDDGLNEWAGGSGVVMSPHEIFDRNSKMRNYMNPDSNLQTTYFGGTADNKMRKAWKKGKKSKRIGKIYKNYMNNLGRYIGGGYYPDLEPESGNDNTCSSSSSADIEEDPCPPSFDRLTHEEIQDRDDRIYNRGNDQPDTHSDIYNNNNRPPDSDGTGIDRAQQRAERVQANRERQATRDFERAAEMDRETVRVNTERFMRDANVQLQKAEVERAVSEKQLDSRRKDLELSRRERAHATSELQERLEAQRAEAAAARAIEQQNLQLSVEERAGRAMLEQERAQAERAIQMQIESARVDAAQAALVLENSIQEAEARLAQQSQLVERERNRSQFTLAASQVESNSDKQSRLLALQQQQNQQQLAIQYQQLALQQQQQHGQLALEAQQQQSQLVLHQQQTQQQHQLVSQQQMLQRQQSEQQQEFEFTEFISSRNRTAALQHAKAIALVETLQKEQWLGSMRDYITRMRQEGQQSGVSSVSISPVDENNNNNRPQLALGPSNQRPLLGGGPSQETVVITDDDVEMDGLVSSSPVQPTNTKVPSRVSNQAPIPDITDEEFEAAIAEGWFISEQKKLDYAKEVEIRRAKDRILGTKTAREDAQRRGRVGQLSLPPPEPKLPSNLNLSEISDRRNIIQTISLPVTVDEADEVILYDITTSLKKRQTGSTNRGILMLLQQEDPLNDTTEQEYEAMTDREYSLFSKITERKIEVRYNVLNQALENTKKQALNQMVTYQPSHEAPTQENPSDILMLDNAPHEASYSMSDFNTQAAQPLNFNGQGLGLIAQPTKQVEYSLKALDSILEQVTQISQVPPINSYEQYKKMSPNTQVQGYSDPANNKNRRPAPGLPSLPNADHETLSNIMGHNTPLYNQSIPSYNITRQIPVLARTNNTNTMVVYEMINNTSEINGEGPLIQISTDTNSMIEYHSMAIADINEDRNLVRAMITNGPQVVADILMPKSVTEPQEWTELKARHDAVMNDITRKDTEIQGLQAKLVQYTQMASSVPTDKAALELYNKITTSLNQKIADEMNRKYETSVKTFGDTAVVQHKLAIDSLSNKLTAMSKTNEDLKKDFTYVVQRHESKISALSTALDTLTSNIIEEKLNLTTKIARSKNALMEIEDGKDVIEHRQTTLSNLNKVIQDVTRTIKDLSSKDYDGNDGRTDPVLDIMHKISGLANINYGTKQEIINTLQNGMEALSSIKDPALRLTQKMDIMESTMNSLGSEVMQKQSQIQVLDAMIQDRSDMLATDSYKIARIMDDMNDYNTTSQALMSQRNLSDEALNAVKQLTAIIGASQKPLDEKRDIYLTLRTEINELYAKTQQEEIEVEFNMTVSDVKDQLRRLNERTVLLESTNNALTQKMTEDRNNLKLKDDKITALTKSNEDYVLNSEKIVLDYASWSENIQRDYQQALNSQQTEAETRYNESIKAKEAGINELKEQIAALSEHLDENLDGTDNLQETEELKARLIELESQKNKEISETGKKLAVQQKLLKNKKLELEKSANENKQLLNSLISYKHEKEEIEKALEDTDRNLEMLQIEYANNSLMTEALKQEHAEVVGKIREFAVFTANKNRQLQLTYESTATGSSPGIDDINHIITQLIGPKYVIGNTDPSSVIEDAPETTTAPVGIYEYSKSGQDINELELKAHRRRGRLLLESPAVNADKDIVAHEVLADVQMEAFTALAFADQSKSGDITPFMEHSVAKIKTLLHNKVAELAKKLSAAGGRVLQEVDNFERSKSPLPDINLAALIPNENLDTYITQIMEGEDSFRQILVSSAGPIKNLKVDIEDLLDRLPELIDPYYRSKRRRVGLEGEYYHNDAPIPDLTLPLAIIDNMENVIRERSIDRLSKLSKASYKKSQDLWRLNVKSHANEMYKETQMLNELQGMLVKMKSDLSFFTESRGSGGGKQLLGGDLNPEIIEKKLAEIVQSRDDVIYALNSRMKKK